MASLARALVNRARWRLVSSVRRDQNAVTRDGQTESWQPPEANVVDPPALVLTTGLLRPEYECHEVVSVRKAEPDSITNVAEVTTSGGIRSGRIAERADCERSGAGWIGRAGKRAQVGLPVSRKVGECGLEDARGGARAAHLDEDDVRLRCAVVGVAGRASVAVLAANHVHVELQNQCGVRRQAVQIQRNILWPEVPEETLAGRAGGRVSFPTSLIQQFSPA